MRRTRTAFRTAFRTVATLATVAAAVVLLTGCGGSDQKNSASSSSSARSSAPTTGAAPAGSTFCTQAAAVEATVGSTLANQSDPASVQKALQTAATQIRAIDPPSEIAADWKALAGGVEQLATAFASVNFSDEHAVAQFEQQANQLEQQLSGASANVEKYLSEKCGLKTPTGSAAPTS